MVSNSDVADHQLFVMQFFRCLPPLAAGLLMDDMTTLVAVRIEDPDIRVRRAAMKAMQRMSKTVKGQFASKLCTRLEDEDDEIREVAIETLMRAPGAAVAPLAGWAIDRLVAQRHPWGVCHALQRLVGLVATSEEDLDTHLKPHVHRLLDCVMHEATPSEMVDACIVALKSVPPDLLDDKVVRLGFPGWKGRRVPPAAITVMQQWDLNDLPGFEEWVCTTLADADTECRLAVLPLFQRLPQLTRPECIDRVIDTVIRHRDSSTSDDLIYAVADVLSKPAEEETCPAGTRAVGRLLPYVADSDLRVRRAAAGVLQRLPGNFFLDQETVVVQLLSSADRDVIVSMLDIIIVCMKDTRAPWVVDPLIKLLGRHEGDWCICHGAAKALMSRTKRCLAPHAGAVARAFVEAGSVATDILRTTEAVYVHSLFVPELKILLSHESVETRRNALMVLTYMCGTLLPPLKPELEARLSDPSFSVRHFAIQLLQNTGEWRAVNEPHTHPYPVAPPGPHRHSPDSSFG